MRVVVPFAAERPKTRLDGVLTPDERVAFSRVMLADVLDAVLETGHDPEVLATTPLDDPDGDDCSDRGDDGADTSAGTGTGGDDASDGSGHADGDPPRSQSTDPPAASPLASVPVRVDDRALTPAVDAVLAESDVPVAVVMADLALATPAALARAFAADGEVVLVPGRGGGTNVLLSRHPEFRVDYHGASYLDHLARAREIDATIGTVDSFRLACDVDEPTDLVEVLLHSENRTARWLREAGFSLAIRDGRVGVKRIDGRR